MLASFKVWQPPDSALTKERASPLDYHFNRHNLMGLTKYLAAFAGPRDIRANAISHGGLRADFHRDLFLPRYCSQVSLKRMAECNDIKGVVVFLASDAFRYIIGHNIIMDGGCIC